MTGEQKQTILVVDDEPHNLGVLNDYLHTHGFRVMVAEDGETALERAARTMPDLILLDILMPGIDGFDTCRALKKNEVLKHIPVLFMTVMADMAGKVKGFELGAVDYITKPVQMEEMLARINTHLALSRLQRRLEQQNVQLEQEIEERRRAQEAVKKSEERFRRLVEYSSDGVIILDAQGLLLYESASSERILGYKAGELLGTNVCDLVHPDEREKFFLEVFNRVKESSGAVERVELRVRHKDDSWRILEITITNLLDDPYIRGVVVNFHDVTRRRRAEEKIKAALEEKDILLKEIHHRVKNNLQIISSLLDLQLLEIKDKTTIKAFRESRNRIRSLAMIHEVLYHSEDLGKIDFDEYIASLTNDLFSTYNVSPDKVTLKKNIEDLDLDINVAITCGMLINELISNSLKYAFPGERRGEIIIDFILKNNEYRLTVGDNGIGFPRGLDFRSADSLGLQLVNNYAQKLKAAIKLDRRKGTVFKLVFKKS